MLEGPFAILLIEDSEEDLFLFRRALGRTGRNISISHVRNGMDAQRYLRGDDEFSDRAMHPLPRLLFSDLSLPMMTGLELLQWLREQPDLKSLPYILFSGSANPSDVHTAYSAGATSFLVKPGSFSEWVRRLDVVMKFWTEIAQSPSLVE